MVALVIMGLLASAVVVALPREGLTLPQQAERFGAVLLRARDEAVFANHQVRVVLAADGYRFEQREERAWRPLETPPFKAGAWPAETQVTASEHGVVFEATGQATPVELAFARGDAYRTVTVDTAGNVTLDAPRAR